MLDYPDKLGTSNLASIIVLLIVYCIVRDATTLEFSYVKLIVSTICRGLTDTLGQDRFKVAHKQTGGSVS